MRKEVLYAIVAGISIGLAVAFGTWKVSKLVKVTPAPIVKRESPTPKPVDTTTITNLKDYDVVTENPIIKGLSAPNKDIIISTQNSDYYIKSNTQGEFEKQIEIPAGMSEVKINETKLILVYSSAVETGKTATAGTVTDIATEAIQIKNDKGEIKQISVNTNTKFINTLKKNIEVKVTDLAIGDYIVAIGIVSVNKVMSSERILITSPLIENKIAVEKITIEKLSKTMINDIKLPTKWNGPNVKELEVGEEIYITGFNPDEKTYTLRSIFKRVE